MTQEVVLDFKNILLALKKYLPLILFVTAATGISFFLYAKYLITPVYQSQATLIIRIPDTEAAKTTAQYDLTLSQELVNTYSVILKDNTILSIVSSNLKLGVSPSQLASKITITGVGSTQILTLNVSDVSPKLATAIANEIIRLAPDEIERTVNSGTLVVISPPEAGSAPVSPNKRMLTIIGLTTGLFASSFLVLLFDTLNDKIRSESDVRSKLGYTVIGVIPDIKGNKRMGKPPA